MTIVCPSCGFTIQENPKITQREHDVIKLLIEGKTNLEISKKLVISLSTVHNHISNLLRKTGRQNRIQLVVYVMANALEEHFPN